MQKLEVVSYIEAAKRRTFLLPDDALKAHINSVTLLRIVPDIHAKWLFNVDDDSSMSFSGGSVCITHSPDGSTFVRLFCFRVT